MKLRTVIGFGIGYVLGARSQSSDTDDPGELIKSITQSEAFKAILDQGRQLAATGIEAVTGQEPQWAQPSSDGSESSDGDSSGSEASEEQQKSQKSQSTQKSQKSPNGQKSQRSQRSSKSQKSS